MQNAIRWVLLCAAAAFFTVEIARADSPVIWKGANVQWLNSGNKSAGLCKTDSNGVQTPYTTNGIVKMSSGVPGAAVSGTDYAPATSGSSILKGNGSGGFSSAVSGTDYAPATSGSAILKGNGSGGFSSAVSGSDYAPATSGSTLLKGNGAGGFSSAVADTDYQAPISLGAFGSSPNSNGASFSSDTLTLQPADATNPGGVSTSSQTFAGAKTFSSAPTFSTMTVGSVLFSGTGGLLSQDNSNFSYNDSTGLLTLNNGAGASTTGLRVYSASESQIQIYDTSGPSNWAIGAAGGNFYMEKGGGPFFIKAYAGIQLWGGSGVPRWAVVGSFTDNSTSVSDIIPGGTIHDVPVFVAQNTNTTANNYSGWVTSAGTAGSMSTTQADTAILGIHESHTVGSETGHLEFYVQDSGAGLVKALNLAKDKTVTMPAYGAGAAVFDSSGVLSSVAPGTSGNVLTSNGTTWVSSPSSGGGTVTSVAMTVPSFLSVSGSPVTTSGTLAVSLSGTALPVANGGTGQTSYTDGQLLIGNSSGNTLTKSTLTAGSGITITNGGGSITIASSGGGCSQPVLTKTSDYTVLTGDFTCANKTLMVECNGSSPMTITLPAASNTGYEVDVVNVGSATCTVASAGGDTFGSTADTTLVLPPSGNFPQVGQQLKANGGTRWNGF